MHLYKMLIVGLNLVTHLASAKQTNIYLLQLVQHKCTILCSLQWKKKNKKEDHMVRIVNDILQQT